MHSLLADLRFAFRSFRKAPVFTAVAVLSLALGIGANTAIFTLLDQVLLRLLPVKDPQQLVLLTMRGRHYGSNWGANAISYPMYRDFQDHNQVFSAMFCRRTVWSSVSFGGQTERSSAELVSGTYFPTLGVGAAIGRVLAPDDDRTPDGAPLVVLAYDYWQTRFGADRGVLGKTLTVDGNNMTIVGVTQPGFEGVQLGFTPNFFIPISMAHQLNVGPKEPFTDRRSRWVNVFGRLKPGASVTEAKASLQPYMHSMLEMEVQQAAFAHASPYDREQFLKCWMDVLPGSHGQALAQQQLSTPLWVLMAITFAVLLIACANIANLLLARAAGRQKEIAVRLAMGASRLRIVRQLLIESLALSAMGAAAGLALAYCADRLMMATFVEADSGFKLAASPDSRILLFTLAVTALTGVLFGMAPAIQSTNPDVGPTLKDQAGAVVGGGSGALLRKTLVVAQVALSLLLLIGAGLFVRSLNSLLTLSPGFPVERLLGFELNPTLSGYKSDRVKLFYERLRENLGAVAGVRSVGLANMRILEQNEWDSSMTVEGYVAPRAGSHPEPYMNLISPNYFATMGIPVLEGREFNLHDTGLVRFANLPNPEPDKAIINETFAKRYFAGRDPIGRHVGFGSDPGMPTPMEVIGVVKDTKYTGLRDEIPEQAFVPYLASPDQDGMTVYVRTSLDPEQFFSIARAQVRELDPNVPVYAMRTMETQIRNSLTTERLIASLSSIFGFLATLLAMVGLYGVMAYTVARRTREIGIRMALGAARASVVWMVMREVVVLVAIGVGLGLPAALALTGLVKTQLFGLAPNDPATMATAVVALAAVAALAGYVPALRASRVDPITALRYE